MAQLAASDVTFVAGEDHAVGVRNDLYVDTEQGTAMEVENVAVAMDLGDGRVGVAHQERVVGVATIEPPHHQQQQQQGYPQTPYYPPPTNPSYYNGSAAAPPPYYHQQPAPVHMMQPPPAPMITQTQDVKVNVVQSQPQTVQVHHVNHVSNYGNGAMIFAVMATFCILFFGCWWSLICTFAAIFFAASASSAGSRGDVSSAKTNNSVSIGCTVTGIVSTVVGIAILFGVIFSTAASSSSSSTTNSNYYG